MTNFDTVRVGLAVAINTIREALLDARSLLHDGRRQDKALTALSELEAMAGSQEPVAWMVTTELQDGTRSTYPLSGRYKDVSDACDFGEPVPLFAAPPAQQPQYEAGDMASAHNDGFRAGVASVAQQPQAEPTKCDYPECSKACGDAAGYCHKQPQVEAVPQAAEFCWLVEHFDVAGNSTGHYYTGKLGIADRVLTTMDPLQAKRYDTWRAANIASVKLGSTMSGTWRAMQHGFHTTPQQAEVVPSDVVRDAERYRWLRDFDIPDDQQEWLCVGVFDMGGVSGIKGHKLDAAIDAAIAAQGAKT